MKKFAFLNSLFRLYKQKVNLTNIETILERDFARSQVLVVFSHLRYEFVKQRPQHLIERMARDMDVIFVEEPIDFSEEEEGTARTFTPFPRVTVIQPKVKLNDFEAISETLYSFTSLSRADKPILWFYSPSFVQMSAFIPSSMIIYDCMDELSQFKGAPAELLSDERQLLAIADLVFTGGYSLYKSKRRRHDAVYCFPSSVERKHFEKALKISTVVPADLKSIPNQIVGFYGVIDERLDLQLLKKTAELMPMVNFVMIGPVVKIAESDLPKLPNIYYLGNKKYDELPAYLKGFSIAFMPFAITKATEFISPTKTVEFMAAQKPIISTAIRDVAEIYPNEVKIAQTVQEMVAAITEYLAESATERRARLQLQKAVLDKTSWDKTVADMKEIMATKLEELSANDTAGLEYYKVATSYRVSV